MIYVKIYMIATLRKNNKGNAKWNIKIVLSSQFLILMIIPRDVLHESMVTLHNKN